MGTPDFVKIIEGFFFTTVILGMLYSCLGGEF